MSVNQVDLIPNAPYGFIANPMEQVLYESPERTTFAITPVNGSGSIATSKGSIESSSGVIRVTNQRIVYIPANQTPGFESFSCPLTHIYDSRVSAPWIGANVWAAAIKPIRDGGLPTHDMLEIKMTFRNGGAFDFHTTIEQIKERISAAMEARGDGQVPNDVHLEDLPTYEDAGGRAPLADSHSAYVAGAQPSDPPPGYAPPGYEEAQADSVRRAEDEICDQIRREL